MYPFVLRSTQNAKYTICLESTVCPTRYRTRHSFNNSKFEQEYVRCVRDEEECVCSAPNCCDTEQWSARQW